MHPRQEIGSFLCARRRHSYYTDVHANAVDDLAEIRRIMNDGN